MTQAIQENIKIKVFRQLVIKIAVFKIQQNTPIRNALFIQNSKEVLYLGGNIRDRCRAVRAAADHKSTFVDATFKFTGKGAQFQKHSPRFLVLVNGYGDSAICFFTVYIRTEFHGEIVSEDGVGNSVFQPVDRAGLDADQNGNSNQKSGCQNHQQCRYNTLFLCGFCCVFSHKKAPFLGSLHHCIIRKVCRK